MTRAYQGFSAACVLVVQVASHALSLYGLLLYGISLYRLSLYGLSLYGQSLYRLSLYGLRCTGFAVQAIAVYRRISLFRSGIKLSFNSAFAHFSAFKINGSSRTLELFAMLLDACWVPLFGHIDVLPTTASDTFKGDHDEHAVVFGCLEGFAESGR